MPPSVQCRLKPGDPAVEVRRHLLQPRLLRFHIDRGPVVIGQLRALADQVETIQGGYPARLQPLKFVGLDSVALQKPDGAQHMGADAERQHGLIDVEAG